MSRISIDTDVIFTAEEVAHLYKGKTKAEFQRDQDAVNRAGKAQRRLDQLKVSKDFQERFARKDPVAVDLHRHLVRVLAEGNWAIDQHLETDANTAASRADAVRSSIQDLAHDPEFMKRFNRGDADAVKQYRDLSVGGLADAMGVDRSEVAPAPEPTVGDGGTAGQPS